MPWILTICTHGWLVCGMVVEVKYDSKADCYESRALVIEQAARDETKFKYIVCKPATRPGGE